MRLAILIGLAAGLLSGLAEGRVDGTLDALANSLSTWLLAPFVVGWFASSRREAALAGLLTCALQLAGYYVFAHDTTASLVAFWLVCAVLGGPLFGAAGHARFPALLAGIFVAEGVFSTGWLWVAVGLIVGARQWRWLALTIPLGLAGELVHTELLTRFF